MRTAIPLALALLLAAGNAAAQQGYRCVDSAGKTFFTDKPGPNCKAVAQRGGTAAAGAFTRELRVPGEGGRPVAPAGQTQKAGGTGLSPERERELLASRCRTYKEEIEWLNSPAGKGVENHAARVGQVNRAMRECR